MNYLNRILLALCIVVCASVVHATPSDTIFTIMKDTATFKKKVAEASKNLSSIEANFTQKKVMSMLKSPAISEGYFCYKNGTQVRWEYLKPFVYLVLINEGKLFVKDDSKTSSYDLTSNKAFLEMNTKLTSIMDGSIIEHHTGFGIRFMENEKYFLADLTPSTGKMEGYFQKIAVYFDRNEYSISAIKMTEKSGDYTEIHFTNKKINQYLPDEKFIIR